MHTIRRAAESFWFLPALLLVGAFALAEATVALDRSMVGAGVAQWPFVNAIGASGSRDLLAAIGGAMLGVAATSFSITISVIATASSTYGPRLVRNFMADRGNQLVLGTFGATFLYALLVLRTVREATDAAPEFVPHLAVTVAIALAVLDVALLIYFIHHIADSIQVPTLASQVLRELQRSVTVCYREAGGPAGAAPDRPASTTVTAEDHGFLQEMDRSGLVDLAVDLDAVIRLVPRPGDHVVAGDALVEVWSDDGVEADRVAARVRRQLTFGRMRAPRQDVRFAAQQLVELAVRALSPSTNDPYTAVTAIIELGTGLSELVDREDPPAVYEHQGRPRLHLTPVPVTEVVDLAFDQLRGHAVASTETMLAMLELNHRLARRTTRPDVTETLRRQEEALRRQYLATDPDPADRARVDAVTVGDRPG